MAENACYTDWIVFLHLTRPESIYQRDHVGKDITISSRTTDWNNHTCTQTDPWDVDEELNLLSFFLFEFHPIIFSDVTSCTYYDVSLYHKSKHNWQACGHPQSIYSLKYISTLLPPLERYVQTMGLLNHLPDCHSHHILTNQNDQPYAWNTESRSMSTQATLGWHKPSK